MRLGFQPVTPEGRPVERMPEAGRAEVAQEKLRGTPRGAEFCSRGSSLLSQEPHKEWVPPRAGGRVSSEPQALWLEEARPRALAPAAGRWRVVGAAAGQLGEAPGQPSPGGRRPFPNPTAHAHPGPRASASVSPGVARPLLPPCWRPFIKPCPASLGSGVLLPALSVTGSAAAQACDLWPVGPARAPEQNRCCGRHEWPTTPSEESVFPGTRWLIKGPKRSEGPRDRQPRAFASQGSESLLADGFGLCWPRGRDATLLCGRSPFTEEPTRPLTWFPPPDNWE